MEEKAYLIIEDKAVKLMELQCQGRVTGQQEAGNTTNHESSPPDRKLDNFEEGSINLEDIPGTVNIMIRSTMHGKCKLRI